MLSPLSSGFVVVITVHSGADLASYDALSSSFLPWLSTNMHTINSSMEFCIHIFSASAVLILTTPLVFQMFSAPDKQ